MENTTVSLVDFLTFPGVLFREFALFCITALQPILHTFSHTFFPQPSCHGLQGIKTGSLQPYPLTTSFSSNPNCPAVPLITLVLSFQNSVSADLLWLCSCLFFFFCTLSLPIPVVAHCAFSFPSIKDVSVCDIVARKGGGVEAQLFNLKQLKPGSIPM